MCSTLSLFVFSMSRTRLWRDFSVRRLEVESALYLASWSSILSWSISSRLFWQLERLDRELQKLMNRLYKTDLTPEKDALDVITRRAVGGEDIDRVLLLNSVEGLSLIHI